MKKNLLALFYSLMTVSLYCQIGSDVESLMKMELFIDRINNERGFGSDSILKSDSLYQLFRTKTSIILDTLSVENSFQHSTPDIQFYRLKTSNIKISNSVQLSDIQLIGIFNGLTNEFIIAVDTRKGLLYRLKGFNGNDFLIFFLDFKDHYENENGKKLNMRTFLRSYEVEGLDIKCLFKSLHAYKSRRSKYNCLNRCSDPVVTY